MERKWNKKKMVSILLASIIVLSALMMVMPAMARDAEANSLDDEKPNSREIEFQTFASGMISDLSKQTLPTSSEDFVGTWINADQETGGMIGFIITEQNSQYNFHGYGACTPTPCDWGITPLTLYSTSVTDPNDIAGTAEYDFGFKETRIFLLMLHPQVILAFNFNEFKDGSGRHHYFAMDYFVKIT